MFLSVIPDSTDFEMFEISLITTKFCFMQNLILIIDLTYSIIHIDYKNLYTGSSYLLITYGKGVVLTTFWGDTVYRTID